MEALRDKPLWTPAILPPVTAIIFPRCLSAMRGWPSLTASSASAGGWKSGSPNGGAECIRQAILSLLNCGRHWKETLETSAINVILGEGNAAKPRVQWPDGMKKVTSTLQFLADMSAEGMLTGRVLRSHQAHARILALRTEKAAAVPGIHALITHEDVPGLKLERLWHRPSASAGILRRQYAVHRRRNPAPDEVEEALSGNLCRCTGYGGIIRAVNKAIEKGVG
ncbi:[2Fe-2S] binding domain-containing protein [Paenibacillus sophorae]|uniref:[2Fe-2S] binding domain-containing protein n=1 Tax=Paenibacillus sophorae TaxID=1333845 RepID=A0A1H8KWG4_9BACL|nr:2Fe-2S iron-sulfur cluster-binding protein [Paenibacillus sophorae]SEN97247.1 [2Fe-2S] binding domain-containing protein [Paenibacillus sophorae]